MKFRIQIAIAGLAIFFTLGTGAGRAQSGTSSVQGIVTDSTGAVVPDSGVALLDDPSPLLREEVVEEADKCALASPVFTD